MSLKDLKSRLKERRDDLRARKVAILCGGSSSEREVSLASGSNVAAALSNSGYNAELLSINNDGFSLARAAHELTASPTPSGKMSKLDAAETALTVSRLRSCDVIFSTMHGRRGEDGTWQGLLELLDVPYVSAGVKGSVLAFDKLVSKRLFEMMDIATPEYWLHSVAKSARKAIPKKLKKLVAKPIDEGSSVGIMIFTNDDEGWSSADELRKKYDPLIIEKHVDGRELTATVIGLKDDAAALPITEIKPNHEFYNYEAKYTKGGSEYICPADLPGDTAAALQRDALRIYSEFGLEPYARIDFLLDEKGRHWCLEANTLPGFTRFSLVPMAAKAAGLEFEELCELLIMLSIERWEAKHAS